LALGSASRTSRSTAAEGESVRRHVRSSRPGGEALLDHLLGHAVAVDGGWSAAVDVALRHPQALVVTRAGDRVGACGGRRGGAGGWSAAVAVALRHPEALVVTRAGDRFGASGWRIGSAGSGATRAALDEARQRAAAAADAVESAQGAVASADAELGLARADEH